MASFFPVKTKEKSVKEAELAIAVHMACHGSIRTVDHLGEIMVKYGERSELGEIKLHRTKCTKLITEVVAPSYKEQLLTDVKDKYYSLIIDETTDVATEKDIAIIIYFSEMNNAITDTLLALIPIQSATSESR